MSHLTILPTVLRDAEVLEHSLRHLGLTPLRHQVLQGFGGDRQPVDVALRLGGGSMLGWASQPDGRLALVGDLQRLSRQHHLERLLGRITRAYAAQQAVREAATWMPQADVQIGV